MEAWLKLALIGAIIPQGDNDDFKRNTALQYWNDVVTIRNNVVTIWERCVTLKIVVANRLVEHHL